MLSRDSDVCVNTEKDKTQNAQRRGGEVETRTVMHGCLWKHGFEGWRSVWKSVEVFVVVNMELCDDMVYMRNGLSNVLRLLNEFETTYWVLIRRFLKWCYGHSTMQAYKLFALMDNRNELMMGRKIVFRNWLNASYYTTRTSCGYFRKLTIINW